MTKRKLPQLPEIQARAGLEFDPTANALQRWNPTLRAQADASDSRPVISIFGYIGDTWSETPATEASVQSALRAAGDQDVIVNINSPGGSYFVGLAIFNLLRMHKGKVTTRVIGQAASAASVIAMAGDTVEIGRAAFLMIHNALVCACGNRHELAAVAEMLAPFDAAMAELYAARTGKSVEDMVEMMDKETWIGGDSAVEQGFADSLLAADLIEEDPDQDAPSAHAKMKIQAALTKAGYSRGNARALLKEFRGTPSAAATATPSAGASGEPATPSAGTAAPVPAAASQPKSEKEPEVMDINELKQKHPELYAAVFAAGVTAECQRIQAVEAQALPGHVELINKLKFDGKTTGPEAAAQVLAAERSKLGVKAADIAADAAALAGAAAPKPGVTATGSEPKPEAVDKNLPFDERIKAQWDADAKLRAEFGDDFKVYAAYAKAEAAGNVRVLGATK